MSKKSSLRPRNVSKTSVDLQGDRLSVPKGFCGLGKRYFDLLGQDSLNVLQVDAVTGTTETKGVVKSRSIQVATSLKKQGVRAGNVVVIIGKNHINQTIAVLASLFLGAIVAPLDPEFSNSEYLELLNKLKPKVCFCDSRPMSQIQTVVSNMKINPLLINFGAGSEGMSFASLLNIKEDETFTPVSISDPATSVVFILPTQGTTGTPKLICLSHYSIYVQTKTLLEIFNYPDKVLSYAPLSWILQAVLVCASFEADVIRILFTGTISERNVCKMIHDFHIAHALFSVDYANKLISNAGIKDYNLSCLQCVLLNAVNTHYEILHLKKLLPHVKFLQCYCLTETGCIAVTTDSNYNSSLDKPNSVGRLAHNSKIKIIDLDTKENLGQDNYGELYFSGDGVMLGYLKDSEATQAAIEKGYLKTGDMAMFDEDGWIYLKGRIEDLIVMDNYRLCPSELEDIILAHPFCQGCRDRKDMIACVIKNSDKSLTEEKLLKYISERVPEFNRPTKIIFMDEFPRTSVGHIVKRKLRESLLRTNLDYATSLSSIPNI
ncbi:hypothetical protein NQ317_004942 [Molorchus minor]|uniref:AMP-dependent synthetase/ligase domain-containing protein n=1 Tax=Molorchus minor TaxID=1323400 RepID=A0ABQ9JA88_9CUCU|nr:hypothetical protein NQ317_004942 [Molorchus minor]